MNIGSLEATLGVNCDGLRTAESQMRSFEASADSVFSQASGHASAFGAQLLSLVGISLSVGTALAFIKTNIDAISDTSLKSIAGAAMMISRETIEGVEAQQAAYGEYRSYIINMYKELNAETQNHFASGKEMIGAFNALVQMGVYASKDEAKSVGVITDAVKLLHGGFVDQVTVMHEIRGVLEGHAGIHYKLAQQLSTIIGPEWKEIVKQHAQDGTLLKFLEETYKGLAVASGDIQKTLTAQSTTLDTLISQIGKGGLQGLYDDCVNSVILLNDFLREHKDDLIVGIAQGWATISFYINDVKDVAAWLISQGSQLTLPGMAPDDFRSELAQSLKDRALFTNEIELGKELWGLATKINDSFVQWVGPTAVEDSLSKVHGWLNKIWEFLSNESFWHWAIDIETAKKNIEWVSGKVQWLLDIFAKPVTWAINVAVSGMPSWLSGSTGDLPKARSLSTPDKSLAGVQEQARLKASGLFQIHTPDFGLLEVPGWMMKNAPTPPPWKPALKAEKDSKGGAGALESAEKSVRSFIETMNQATAQGAGDTESILQAWKGKQLQTLAELAAKGADVSQAKEALDLAVDAKQRKIDEDFKDWYIAGLNDSYGKLYAEEEKKLRTVTGNAEKTAQVQEYYDKKWQDLRENQQIEATNLFKGYLDSVAGLSPLLSDQIGYKRQALELELQLAEQSLDRQLREQKITQDTYDQARAMQAVVAQAKKYSLEKEGWQKEGVGGGLKMWGTERMGEMEKRGAAQTVEFMKNAESWMGDALGQSLVDKLHDKKTDLMKMFTDLGDATVKSLSKRAVGAGFDMLAGTFGIPGLAGKPDGSSAKPFHVIMGRMGFPGIGGIGGGGQGGWGLFGNLGGFGQMTNQFQKMNKEREDFFNTDDLKKYSDGFGDMSGTIGGFWQSGQSVMTAASLAGGAARIASMASEGGQGLSILSALMQGRILMEAGQAGAAAFRSVMQALPFPVNAIAAPIVAAAAFAATLAFGSGVMGGGGNIQAGGSAYNSTGNMAWGGPSPYAKGDVFDRPIIFPTARGFGLMGEAGPEAILPLTRVPGGSLGVRAVGGDQRGGKGNSIVVHVQMDNHFNTELTEAQCKRSARNMVKAINQEIGNRGQKIGDGR